jgi:hypothetical protein
LGVTENTLKGWRDQAAAGDPLAAPPVTIHGKNRLAFADISLLRFKMLQDGMPPDSSEAIRLFEYCVQWLLAQRDKFKKRESSGPPGKAV